MEKIKFFILIILLASTTVQAQTDKKVSLKDFIKKTSLDKYNDRVTEEDRKTQKPVPGGQIIIRIPTDPKSLNPITDNGQQSRTVNSFIFDSLITRDPETLEWLPWIAKRWETRDRIILKDGSVIEGKIVGQTDKNIKIVKNKGTVVLGKHDIKEQPENNGKVLLNDNTVFKGIIKELGYTLEILPSEKDNATLIPLTEIADREDNPEKKSILKNSVYYFTIRRGVLWHDGQELIVDDIKFSLDVIRNKYVDAAPLRNYYNDIESLKIIDAQTVKFTYSKSYFLSLNFCGGLSLLPKHVYNPEKFKGDDEAFGKYFNTHTANRHPIGNGGYKFSVWNKGKEIIVEKVKNYWAQKCGFPYLPEGEPYLDKIIWTVINNKTAALKELQNGKIDVDFDIEPDIWFSDQTNSEAFLNKFAKAHIIVPMYTYIGWNMDTPFFKDKLVRQAMTHLIPLDKIAKEIHKGLVTRVTGPFYINGPIYDHNIEPYEYSLRKAKRLLRKAGWLDHDGDGIIDKDGKPFQFEYLIHNARDYHQKIADIVKESIEKAGIKMLIRKIDWTIFGETVADRKFDAVRFAWGSAIDSDPFQIWHSSQIKNRGSNYVGFNNERADEILEEGRETFDQLKRWSMYRELHDILNEEQPYTFMFCFQTMFFYNKKFRNVKLYSTGQGYNISEWYIHQSEGE